MIGGSQDLGTLATLAPERAIAKLRAAGELEAAAQFEAASGEGIKAQTFGVNELLGLQPYPWAKPTEALGYVAPGAAGGIVDVIDISTVTPDPALRGQRVNVTLQRLRTYKYPGGGRHTVLFDFETENYAGDKPEAVHYSVSTTAYDASFASITNFPMFRGLCLGSESLAIRCRTMNVSSEGDALLLKFLHSGTLKTGLKLASAAQPAIGVLGDMVDGLAKYLNDRDTNLVVQEVELGLDFSPNAFGARLACGSYIGVQAPKYEWGDWKEWGYDTGTGRLVRRSDPTVSARYNYIVIGIDRYGGD